MHCFSYNMLCVRCCMWYICHYLQCFCFCTWCLGCWAYSKHQNTKRYFTICNAIPPFSVKPKRSCIQKVAFNAKSTPASPIVLRTTYHFIKKGKSFRIYSLEQNYKRFYIWFLTGRESVWPVTPCVFYLLLLLFVKLLPRPRGVFTS